MTLDRRALLAGAAAVAACAPAAPRPSRDVFAAGQPAALLIWALAPERLIGWPRRLGRESARWLPPAAAALPETGALASGAAPASLEAVAALRPRVVLDYGDLEQDYRTRATRLRERLGVDYRLIDGALSRTDVAFREAGEALGVGARGRELADLASGVLQRWRARPVAGNPSFYYARGLDGLETGFRGSLATEVLEGRGWTNVAAGGLEDIGRVSREQVVAWDPEVVVTLDRDFAEVAVDDSLWRARRDGSRRRLLLLPSAPFGWIDRPPSINRLLGCAWLGGADALGRTPPVFAAEAARLIATLFGRQPASTEIAALTPRWIA